jgi:hypothetical protein
VVLERGGSGAGENVSCVFLFYLPDLQDILHTIALFEDLVREYVYRHKAAHSKQ